jgi:U2-associated protein SR140
MSVGDLYSVKIMWPRAPEERTRNRNTGFVCFMNRRDAEDAMEACRDKDPFRVGRPLTMSWGKHVRKEGANPLVQRGTAGGTWLVRDNTSVADTMRFTFQQHHQHSLVDAKHAIRVVVPANRERVKWISTVASFVAQDGAQFEHLLLQQQEPNDPNWNFISPALGVSDESLRQEHVFYKWRVYAFCQGDGVSTWSTATFVMIQPNGCTWYPPPLDETAAQREAEEWRIKEEAIHSLKEQRRLTKRDRPMEPGRSSDSARLTESEVAEMHRLFQEQLSLSRESIRRAMAFCFEKSGAALQIADALKEMVLQAAPHTSAEAISARLYLMSDVLFNSQQPGIRNAFLYRDAIEKMSPEVFRNLGTFVRTRFGRLSQERIGTAISGIFAAWTQWGVFDLSFINDLEAHYEGREIHKKDASTTAPTSADDPVVVEKAVAINPVEDKGPRGDWTCISVDCETVHSTLFNGNTSNKGSGNAASLEQNLDGELLDDRDNLAHNLPKNDNDAVDGVPLDDNDLDGAVIACNHMLSDDDIDGVPLDEDDIDGEPLDDTVSKPPLDDVNVFPMDQDDLDGEPLDEIGSKPPLNDVDDIDGEPLDA